VINRLDEGEYGGKIQASEQSYAFFLDSQMEKGPPCSLDFFNGHLRAIW
jgi:hypothetical protein